MSKKKSEATPTELGAGFGAKLHPDSTEAVAVKVGTGPEVVLRPSPPVLTKAEPPAVIVPIIDPATMLELENKRLTERVAVLEAELRQIQRDADVDFTRLSNVLNAK